jgi:hypothetical protein
MGAGPFHWKWTEHLMAALQQADSFAPCVLLMDEVEQLFEIIIELPHLTHKAIEIDPHRADRDGSRGGRC